MRTEPDCDQDKWNIYLVICETYTH